MSMKDINDADFDSEVMKSSLPVIIDVWAPWCGPCRMYGPIIEDVAKEYEGKIKFLKMNADDNQATVMKFNIGSIPTTLFIKDGKLKAMNVGAIPKEMLKKWISQNM